MTLELALVLGQDLPPPEGAWWFAPSHRGMKNLEARVTAFSVDAKITQHFGLSDLSVYNTINYSVCVWERERKRERERAVQAEGIRERRPGAEKRQGNAVEL